jgi:hypothetical protein
VARYRAKKGGNEREQVKGRKRMAVSSITQTFEEFNLELPKLLRLHVLSSVRLHQTPVATRAHAQSSATFVRPLHSQWVKSFLDTFEMEEGQIDRLLILSLVGLVKGGYRWFGRGRVRVVVVAEERKSVGLIVEKGN